jgi:hypothetical protein
VEDFALANSQSALQRLKPHGFFCVNVVAEAAIYEVSPAKSTTPA